MWQGIQGAVQTSKLQRPSSCSVLKDRNFMNIFVKTQCDGQTVVVKVTSTYTVAYVKVLIEVSSGVPPGIQHLFWSGKELENSRSLCDYGVRHMATFFQTTSGCGGAARACGGMCSAGVLTENAVYCGPQSAEQHQGLVDTDSDSMQMTFAFANSQSDHQD